MKATISQLWTYENQSINQHGITWYDRTAAFIKRATRAASIKESEVENGTICDNNPVTGMSIGFIDDAYNDEWCTIADPRGFTVKVPIMHIRHLLPYCTIENSVIQTPCLWMRDGSVVFPTTTDSKAYLEATDRADVLKNKLIKPQSLTPGDVFVTFRDDPNKPEHCYVFLGVYDLRVNAKEYTPRERLYYYVKSTSKPRTVVQEVEVTVPGIALYGRYNGKDELPERYISRLSRSTKIERVLTDRRVTIDDAKITALIQSTCVPVIITSTMKTKIIHSMNPIPVADNVELSIVGHTKATKWAS